MEQEIMQTVLQEILQELKDQKAELGHFRERLDDLHHCNTELEKTLLEQNSVPNNLSAEQENLLKGWIQDSFEGLSIEMRKQPLVHHTHKQFSLLPQTFRMEHFPLLVNTIMKWVVVLIILAFTMWVTTGLVR